MNITKQQECRICGGEIIDVLDLGIIYRSSFIKDSEVVDEDQKAPLVLCKCENCGLVQLKDTIDLDVMYKQYWYASSLNKSMVSSLKEIICEIEDRIRLKEGDIVLDIGCNDGTMLEMYSQRGLLRVGFDPALNLNRKEFPLFLFSNDYFSYKAYQEGMGDNVGAKVITAIAMFYDLPDPNGFVMDVKRVLNKNGIFVIQFTDLLSMFKATAFDNICHEHLEYYRLLDVKNLLEKHGLDIIDVSYNDVNGGSVRITAAHKDIYEINPRVSEALKEESDYLSLNPIETFVDNIETTKFKTKEFIKWACGHGHRIYLLGASTKGNTLLQICGITNEQVPFAAEVNKEKFGLRTQGSDIKIISEDEALIKHPDYFIVPVWHFKNSILRNPKIIDYLSSNGKLVFPLPYFHVVFIDKFSNEPKEVRI